jgi:hypothetical protein
MKGVKTLHFLPSLFCAFPRSIDFVCLLLLLLLIEVPLLLDYVLCFPSSFCSNPPSHEEYTLYKYTMRVVVLGLLALLSSAVAFAPQSTRACRSHLFQSE